MKKFTMFMAFLLLISWQGMAQISTYYSFSELNSPYVEITGGTIDLVADSDDGEVINVPIGFSFNYAGTLYTSLTIGVNGALSFTSNDVSFTNSLSATGATQTNVIAPLWDDMYFRTVDNAEIMYLTTGTAPNRVFTVQWKNISWRNAGNTVNFQVQLFENTNNIQFNYGALNSTDSRTASIGFNKGTSGTDFISVTPGIPATSSYITDDNNINTTQYPGNGAVYLFTFTPPACPDPSVLSATNLTPTSADLTWTEMGSATTWDIEWGTAGFTPTGTPNIVGTTTNPHNLTGLTANTSYDFYVRADCAGNGTSNWSGPYNFTTPCAAQLAGTYTIGATGNYPTFTDAVNALLACGISAPVVFDVLTGSGPYNEQVAITPITGASATNTITFNGNGETITSSTVSASRSLFLFDGAKHVTINDLVFVPQSSTNNFTVQLTNGADSNTVNNCTIDLTAAISSTSSTNAGIVISGSLTSATSTTQPTGNYNIISNNTVIGGYYGISVAGGNNNNITNNDVQDVYYYGIYHSAVNNTNTSNNKVSRPNRTSVSTTAYYAIYYTGSSENNLTNANELFNPLGSTTSTPTTYLIGHSAADATVGNENMVTNNIIHSVSGNATIYGLYNSGSDGVFYYHNTVSLDDANATAGTTRGFYQTTTATGIEFKNNIITVTRGGTGTKHCIYFNAAASTITSDNNVFYINAPAGTNNLGYFGADQATLVDWQTASSQDASSSDADPIYANLLSNDYTPTNPAIDNIADASVGVANDFFGAARAATPDVGAIEFTPPACAQPSNLVVTNITNSSVDLGWTENGTATIWDIEWGTAGFTPTGTPTIVGTTTNPYNLTGLTDLTTYEFYVRADCGGTESAWSGPFSFTTTCGTPLAGNYTIGAAGTYPTFTDAVNALLACGISAPVVFDVLTGSGPYNEQVTITPVTGASATNTITFNGNGETITSSTLTGSRSLFLLDGAKHVTINDLVFVPQSSTNNFTVQLTNGADSNTVNNCTIDLTAAISSTSSTNAGIVISGSLTSATSTTQPTGNYNTITNNIVIGGYYGIAVAGGNNNNITNNDVQDVYYYGIYHSAVNNTNTSNNKVSRPNRTSVSTSAYYAIYYTGSSENNLTNANELFNPLGSTTSTPTTYLIGHSSADATVGNENIVTNNIIHSVSGNATVYGLYNSGSDGVFYYHNTVSLDDASATSGTTRGFYQLTTASGIELKNNIITITRGGTGAKYCVYFGATGSTITSDNNVFYINAPAGTNNLGYFSATAQATLVDWQTASSQDASSSDADPLYVNLSVNDLTPSNPAVDGIADASVGVANDFFGAARAATPDPGAIEFTPPACPQPSALTATNITATTADLGWTENGTATVWDIEWGAAGFTPTGTPNIVGTTTNPHNLTGLTAQTTYEFYVRADCGGSGASIWVGPFTFTTECSAVVAPWIESFENAGAIPACWSQGNTNSENWLFDNSGTGTYIGNGGVITGATTSGNYFAWVDDSSPHSTGTALVSPYIDVTALINPMLSFFLISDNEDDLNVDFSVDVWDGAAWNTGVYTSNANTLNGGWEQIDVYLSSLTITGDIRLRFVVDENNGTDYFDDVAIDDVEIKEAPSCPDPSALTATNITATTADLGWTENGSATNWQVEWDTTGFVQGTGNIAITGNNPYNVTGLTPFTSYEFYVRSICGTNDTSAWSGPYTFSYNHCTPTYTYGCTNGARVNNVTTTSAVVNINNTATECASGALGYTDYSSAHSLEVLQGSTFDINVGISNYDAGVIIWIDYNQNAIYEASEIITQSTTEVTAGSSHIATITVPVTALLGETRMRIRAVEGSTSFDACSNYSWGEAEEYKVIILTAITCSDPSNLTAFNIQPTNVMLDWTENGTATNWNIEWDVTGFTLGTGNLQAVAAKPYLLQGLTPGTAYDYYVQADCGMGDTSNWVGPYTFTTPPCMPIGLNLGADTTLCANQNITLDAGAGNYIYSWSTGGSAQTEVIDTTLMGGNGTYNVSVTVVDNVSGCIYTDDINITFQTCTNIDELNGANAFNIYPNPTKGILSVSMASTTANTVLTIVDVQGKVVFTKTNFNTSSGVVETIDLSGNDKGIYFVNFTNEQTSIVKKVVLH